MNLRKLLALLIAAIMLLGMVPAGHAEGGNMMPGGEFTVSCNHNWAWRWPNGQPANCQDWKWSESYCTLCGMVDGGFEQCGPCQPGSWHWDGNPPANCNEWGIQNQSCSVCGEVFNEREVRGDHQWGGYTTVEPAGCETPGEEVSNCTVCGERGSSREIPAKGHDWGDWKREVEATCNKEGLRVRYCKRCNMRDEDYVQGGEHQWGEWITTVEPTCMEQGRHHHTCQRCGATMWEYMPKANHVFGDWRVIEEPQVGIPGTERRACIYGCGTHEDREIPPLEEALSAVGLELTLVLSSTPANGTHFVVGEEVVFTETWVNNTDKTLYPFSVSIWTCGTPVFGSEIDQICSWFAEDAGGPVAPGASGSHTLTVTVTEADVARGAIYAMAELLSTVQDGPDLENVTTPFVTAPCGEGKLENSAGVHLEKFIRNAPANGEYYVPGEVLNYALTLILDDGLLLDDAAIYDPIIDNDELVISYSKGLYGSMGMDIFYTVTEEDTQRGYVENTAYATWIYSDSGKAGYCESETVIAPCGEGELLENDNVLMDAPGIAVIKSLHNTPANGAYYVPGEWIHFHIEVDNNTDADLTDIILTDPLVNKTFEYDVIPANDFVATVVSYQVTEQDAAIGSVENYAQVRMYTAEGYYNLTSNTVTALCGVDNSGDFGLANGLTVTKSVTSTPANGRYYEPGEDITFVITVSNQGIEQLLNVNVIDPLGGGLVTVLETLNVGETRDITVVFTTTDIVAWAGSVDNGACVKAVDQDGRQYVEYSNIVTVPCGHTFLNVTITPDNPFGIFHSVAVVKKEESLPLNGQYYTEGEVIHYTITYTNDGELPLTDVQIWDVLNVATPVASAEMLNPGESRVCYYQHTVTAEDVAVGSVMNVAHASYPVPNAAGFANSTSNVVISRTSADENVWIELPIFPTPDEDPEYDPGTGWVPDGDPIPEGENPPFGTIDTDALRGGDSYCVRTITGRDNVSVSYEITFCAEHANIQSAALMMTQAAATPELQMQAAAYAVALWRAEVQKLYQEIYKASDPTAKTVVMTEYIRFLTDVANYEAMLKVLYPDQPALVALKVAEVWKNKCVDLCYDAHATAAERKDSLLAVTPATGASVAECTCVTATETNGQKTDVQNYCPAHSFPFSMIDMLLQGNDTAESWTMVRQIWGVELTSAYNKLYTAMGDNKLLAMAEYNALTQWMMAREAFLIALYPDNPEIVVQIMVKTIMERVNALCQVVN